jgi:aminopeptidase N
VNSATKYLCYTNHFMQKFIFSLILTLFVWHSFGQKVQIPENDWSKTPRLTPTRINDLVHTKLNVRFDYAKAHLYGKAWITLTPHFSPTDSLTLDAKGMELHKVSIIGYENKKIGYDYDGFKLKLKLPKTYRKGDQYTVFINYTSKPNEFEALTGADPMLGIKGLYFINPMGEIKDKPIQIWTQGETESNSVWFPTIDQTQQKTTQELYMTVPSKYVSLSNGKLVSQTLNKDGTRTDYWKMDLPHSPYLFFMGVGDYAVVKDSWRGKEVNYYVEKEYRDVAKTIFGNTPEMMSFFSRITGVDYPWNKYSQITGRDYVAGAMENTTATIHQNAAQQDARELTDKNKWEGTVAHELFHQWFGDYVTAESWSNLTLNESFANYSQVLWNEHKYGKDAGDAENYFDMQNYLAGDNSKKDLVRFFYDDREQMFDAVSYQKGGRILHMLRNYLGDSAFFKGLNVYLTSNKFKSAEAHHLRLALEDVSGKDLTWFFNQWYFGSGHPKLDINYRYDDATKQAFVIVKQTQLGGKIFRIPTYIDVYSGKVRYRHQVWLENAVDTFKITVASKPDLINFDGDKVLLCEKEENKTLEAFIHQYNYAASYVDRLESINFCGKNTANPKAIELLKTALKDPYPELREMALGNIRNIKDTQITKSFETSLVEMTKHEKIRTVKAELIALLGEYKNTSLTVFFEDNISDSSYSVSGAALKALSKIDSTSALSYAEKLSKQPSKGKLDASINSILIAAGKEEIFEKLEEKFKTLEFSDEKFLMMQQIGDMAGKMKSIERIKKAISLIILFRDEIPAQIKSQTDPYINGFILGALSKKLKDAGKIELNNYLESEMKKK